MEKNNINFGDELILCAGKYDFAFYKYEQRIPTADTHTGRQADGIENVIINYFRCRLRFGHTQIITEKLPNTQYTYPAFTILNYDELCAVHWKKEERTE